MRRDVRATNPALMGATVLEAPHCRQHLQSHQALSMGPSCKLKCLHWSVCHNSGNIYCEGKSTCWQRRNIMRVAESRSSKVSGLLQLLHSTYLHCKHIILS